MTAAVIAAALGNEVIIPTAAAFLLLTLQLGFGPALDRVERRPSRTVQTERFVA